MLRIYRYTSLALAISSLFGCALKEIEKMDAQAQGVASQAQRITESRASVTQPTVTWVDKPWVNLKPIVSETSSRSSIDHTLPDDCFITINRPDGISLQEVAQRITALCGFSVSFTSDAMQRVSPSSTMSTAVTQQMNGTLPKPDDNGRVPLSQINNSNSGNSSEASGNFSGLSTPAVFKGLTYRGYVKGLLNEMSSLTGLSWRVEQQGRVVFYFFDTRMYQLSILNTKFNNSSNVTSSSSSTQGNSGGAGSNVSGDATSSQRTSFDIIADLYEDVRNTVNRMLTKAPIKGDAWLSGSSGTLTVTDTPEVQERVRKYVDYQNQLLNRQVQLNVEVLSVSLSSKHQIGLDWGLVYKSLSGMGATVSGGFSNASNSAISSGFSILDTATGSAAKFSGSDMLIKALSTQGNVSMVTQLQRATTNLRPVPFQISDQTGYIQSSSSTATANVGVTSSMQTAIITTGLFITMRPYIESNGNIQLDFAFSLSDKPTITPFTTNSTRNDVPEYRLRSLSQTINMRAGQTQVLVGADQIDTTANKQGSLSPDNFALGGGRDGSKTRTTLVILITPILLG